MLGKIQAISDSFESTNIFIIDDFNADIKKPSLFTPYQAARESFLIWRSAETPRHGPLYDIMKIRRAHFKCKRLCEKKC